MPSYIEQADALLGIHAERIAAICRVNRTTALRWKLGRSRMPFTAFALVMQVIEGFCPPGSAWTGWRFGADGRLYAPDLKRGFEPHHIQQLEYLLRMFSWSEQLRAWQRDALNAIRAGHAAVVLGNHVEDSQRDQQAQPVRHD